MRVCAALIRAVRRVADDMAARPPIVGPGGALLALPDSHVSGLVLERLEAPVRQQGHSQGRHSGPWGYDDGYGYDDEVRMRDRGAWERAWERERERDVHWV